MSQQKVKFICAIVWLAMTMNLSSAINVCEAEQLRGRTILITPRPPSPNAPRTPAYNPFYAELTDLGVLLLADIDWGDATVTLSSIEGDYYQTTFDMADMSILLPVNGDAGDSYTLTIFVENGLAFEGEFIL